MLEVRSVLDRSHFLEGMLWCFIYGYEGKRNLSALQAVHALNKILRNFHSDTFQTSEYVLIKDDNLGPGQAREFADEATPDTNSRHCRRAKRHDSGKPDDLIKSWDTELKAGDPHRKKMRRKYTPANLPIKEDADLDDCPSLLEARKRGYEAICINTTNLRTKVRMHQFIGRNQSAGVTLLYCVKRSPQWTRVSKFMPLARVQAFCKSP